MGIFKRGGDTSLATHGLADSNFCGEECTWCPRGQCTRQAGHNVGFHGHLSNASTKGGGRNGVGKGCGHTWGGEHD